MRIPARMIDRLLTAHASLGRLLEQRWTHHPFGRTPHASRDYYQDQYDIAKSLEDGEAERVEQEQGFSISRKKLDEFAKYTQIVKKTSKLNYSHGRILYSCLRAHIAANRLKRVNIVETGTARGFSALCMAAALQDSGIDGVIISIDLTSHSRRQIWNCIEDHDGPKSRAEIISRWPHLADKLVFLQGSSSLLLSRLGLSKIDFAFLDAQHTKDAVMQEFKCVEKMQKAGDLIVFDDVTPSLFSGVCEAVNEIESQGSYLVERISSSEQRGYAIARRKV